MTVEEILTICRGLLDDAKGAGKPLWSDAELVEYANNAETRIAEECLVLKDSDTATDGTDPVCVIPLATPFTNTIALHPSIVKVYEVGYGANRTPLTLTSRAHLDNIRPGWRLKTGTPQFYINDATTGQIVLDKIPTATSSLYLSVARLPLVEMDKSNMKASPSIPAKYHRKLINGIIGRAYLKQDAETLNLTKATTFNQQFDGDVEQIKRDVLRYGRGELTCLRRHY
jgi:hypothetical protein